jgi:hypothetical protein
MLHSTHSVLFLGAKAGTLSGTDRRLTGTVMPSSKPTREPPTAPEDTAPYLDMPPERRAAAKAHAALLSRTADRIARELPMSADVDDFRRVLTEEAKP